MSDDLKERLDVLIRTEQTGSRLLMQLGIDVLARIKDLERPCASRPCIRDGRGHVTGEAGLCGAGDGSIGRSGGE